MARCWIFPVSLVALSGLYLPLHAAEPKLTAKQLEFFETRIRPVLVKSCYECHSAKSSKVKGGLLLDTRAGIEAGGDSGEAVVPGDPEKSLIISALRHEDFKMPPKERLAESVINDFVEWVKMGAPDPRTGQAEKAYKTLTLEESKSFWSFKPVHKPAVPKVKDTAWARSDVDRFILAQLESRGMKPVGDADPSTLLRRIYFDLTGLPPRAADVDSFLQQYAKNASRAVEQVIDQLLASPQYGERWGRYWLDVARFAETNGNADNIPFPDAWRYRDYVIRAVNEDKPYNRFIQEQIAGDLLPAADDKQRDQQLIATGLLALTSKPRAQNNPDYKYDLIADQIDVTTRATMGLSVMCARCHDHKFDPISQKEYYSMAGIFDSSVMLFGANAGKGGGNNKKNGGAGGNHKLSDGSTAMGVREGKPADLRVCVRGESQNLGDVAPRGLLAAVNIGEDVTINSKQSGRLELAQWLTSPQNPFTTRIAVNRIWQHLFGQGLVRSPDNFGNLGERPSHPELLDYLAAQFVENGWSLKKSIKATMLSHTYQLSSAYDEKNYTADPDNFNLWRMPIRRLDAEAIRDATLLVSGKLDLAPLQGTLLGSFQPKGKNRVAASEDNHRSIYQAMVRGAPLPEVLALFDIANPNLVVAQREVTTVPAQALFLMNSSFIQTHSRAFAQQLLSKASMTESERVDLAYKMAFGRNATAEEKGKVLDYVTAFVQEQPGQQAAEAAWTTVCQTLYAAAEFRYLQ